MGREAKGSPDDWFRSDAWGAGARELFEEKLSRSRSSRSQYLLIKGMALLDVGDGERTVAGRQLIQRLFDEHPDDDLTVARGHSALGKHFGAREQLAEAEEHLRACMAIETASNRFSTELRLGELLVELGPDSVLGEASALLDTADAHGSIFNVELWRMEVSRARLLARQGAGKRGSACAGRVGFAGERWAHPPSASGCRPHPCGPQDGTGDGEARNGIAPYSERIRARCASRSSEAGKTR